MADAAMPTGATAAIDAALDLAARLRDYFAQFDAVSATPNREAANKVHQEGGTSPYHELDV
jgi:hypothetical protein